MRSSDEPGLSIHSPTVKCSSISTMNSTTAAGSAASPKASSSSGMPMLPELLNIIGGRKVFTSSPSQRTSGHSTSPEPSTTTAPPSARPAYSSSGAWPSASTANTSMGTKSSMLRVLRVAMSGLRKRP